MHRSTMPKILPVRYSVIAADPAAHRFTVTCTVENPDPAGQRFALPAWIPGSYLIRDFARNIVSIRAEAGGKPEPFIYISGSGLLQFWMFSYKVKLNQYVAI